MARKRPPFIQLALLGFLLVFLPVGSYLYLEWGYDYRVDSLNELAEYGPVNAALTYDVQQKSSVDVIYVSGQTPADSVVSSIASVHDAFDDQPLVQFVGIGDSGPALLEDASQSWRTPSSSETLARFTTLSAQDPHCQNVPVTQRAVVVDTAGMVRRCYNLHSGEGVSRLVEHLTMLVPMPEQEDVYLEREREY